MLLNLQGWKSKMATTSIWAVKDNLDRVLNYASNPLKTKETDSGYEYEGLENVLDYAVNDDKTERQLYVSGLNCHPFFSKWNRQKGMHTRRMVFWHFMRISLFYQGRLQLKQHIKLD